MKPGYTVEQIFDPTEHTTHIEQVNWYNTNEVCFYLHYGELTAPVTGTVCVWHIKPKQ